MRLCLPLAVPLFLLACSSNSAPSRTDPGGQNAAGSAAQGSGAGPAGGSGSVIVDPGAVSNGGSSGAGAGDNCGADQYQADGRPLALFILLDQSGSMTEFGDRWTPVTTALEDFVSDPGSQSLRAGLQYFPYLVEDDDLKCEVERYAEPAVTIDELSVNATAIVSSMDEHYFTHEQYEDEVRSGTPTRPAFEGSAEYVRGWLEENPDHAGVIVLATDGDPTGVCDDNGVDEVAAAIAEARDADPPIKTYVIGIGELSNLEEMAEAGGTDTPAFIVDGSGETTGDEFRQALDQIRGAALPCDYALPTPTSGALEPSLVNVRYSASSGTSGSLFKVDGVDACSGEPDEWYYDDPAEPERLVLCPAACSVVAADSAGQVDVLLGCPTVVR